MGIYLHTHFNDITELYLIINNIKEKDFKGYLYMIWNGQERRLYCEENNIKKDFTGGYPFINNDLFIKYLEEKYFCHCEYHLVGFDGEKEYCRFCSKDYLPNET